MKKILISLVILIIAAVTITYSVQARYANMTEVGATMTYDEALKSNHPSIMIFYADWCTYCTRFAPRVADLKKYYNGQYNLVLMNGDDDFVKKMMLEYMVVGYPTMYIFDPKIDNRVHIDSGYYGDTKKLKGELDRYLRIRKMINIKD